MNETTKNGSKDKIDEMFNYIYDKYKPLLIFIASKYLNNPFDVMDVVQDTFIEFLKDLIKYYVYCFHLIPLFFMTMVTMMTRKERKWAKTVHKGGKTK